MAKTLTQRNVLIAVASFVLIWFVVVKQKVSEHMTGAARVSEADKDAIIVSIIQSIIPPRSGVKPPTLSAEAKKQLAFLEQNPITAIDDKFMSNLKEIAQILSKRSPLVQELSKNPDDLKKAARSVGNLMVANVIWRYADAYEKLKAAPTQSEFKEQLGGILAEDTEMKNVIAVMEDMKRWSQKDIPEQLQRDQKRLDALKKSFSEMNGPMRQINAKGYERQMASIEQRMETAKDDIKVNSFAPSVLGENPIQSNSPLVNQIFDIAYKYYFGETISASNIASGAWTAVLATFGSLGAIAVVGAIVYFVFLRR